MADIPIAVQLHTIRQEMSEDMPGTLKRVAEIGYHGVELVRFDSQPEAGELKAMIDDCGLKLVSSHAGYDELKDSFDATIEYHRELGHRDLVLGAVPPDMRASDELWMAAVREVHEIARRCKDAGFRLSMHNHAFELEETINGVEAHHYIFTHIPPVLLNAQLDTFFIEDVGKDPAEYIRKFKGRGPLLHIKDKGKPEDPDDQTQIGNGTIDWDAAFAAAVESGVEWYIVEQKRESVPGIESVKTSFDYLQSRGMV